MQVDPTAALAPVLSRFSVALDGPLDAAIVSRLAAVGDGRVLFGDLVRPVPGGPQLALPDAVAQVRATLSRLLAAGAAEAIGGGYRLTDPRLAQAVQRAVAETAPAFRPSAAPAPASGTAPTGTVSITGQAAAPTWAPVAVGPEVTRTLQLQMASSVARSASVPATPPLTPVPTAWQQLLGGGWTIDRAGHPPGTVSLQGPTYGTTAPLVRLLVADPSSPPAIAGPTVGARWPVLLTHVPAPDVQWGAVDVGSLSRVAADLGAVLAGSRDAVVVLDRPLAAALLMLRDSLPGPAILDLRGPAPQARVDTTLATALAGAAGVVAPRQRSRATRVGRSGRAGLLDLLFGPGWTVAGDDAEREGTAGEQDSPGGGSGGPVAVPAGSSVATNGRLHGGAVITSRAADRHAAALGEVLGLEVVVLGPGDDLADEVLAWIEDDTGRTLLAPRA